MIVRKPLRMDVETKLYNGEQWMYSLLPTRREMADAESTVVPGSMPGWCTHPAMVTHPGTNRAWCRVTTLIESPLSQVGSYLKVINRSNTTTVSMETCFVCVYIYIYIVLILTLFTLVLPVSLVSCCIDWDFCTNFCVLIAVGYWQWYCEVWNGYEPREGHTAPDCKVRFQPEKYCSGIPQNFPWMCLEYNYLTEKLSKMAVNFSAVTLLSEILY